MKDFPKHQIHEKTTHWIGSISQEDIETLPLIILGLNYRQYFPQSVPESYFTRQFLEQHPQLMFYKSKLTDKIMAAGYQTLDIVETSSNYEPSESM